MTASVEGVCVCDGRALLRKLLGAQACFRPGTVGVCTHSPRQGARRGEALGDKEALETVSGPQRDIPLEEATQLQTNVMTKDWYCHLPRPTQPWGPRALQREPGPGDLLGQECGPGRAEVRAPPTSEVLPAPEVGAWGLCWGARGQGKAQVVLAQPNPGARGREETCWGEQPGWIYVSSPLTLGGPMGCCCSPRPLCSFVLPLPMVGAACPAGKEVEG